MICNKCGKENQEGANFCRYCGNSLQKDLAALIEKAKRNDQEAISELYWYSSSELLRVVKVMVKDDDSESGTSDAVAEGDRKQYCKRLAEEKETDTFFGNV